MRSKFSRSYRHVRHAARLRHQKGVEADMRAARQGKIEHPVPDVRPLDNILIEGAYADQPVTSEINRYCRTRGMHVETLAKIRRLHRRRMSRRAKQAWQENCFRAVEE